MLCRWKNSMLGIRSIKASLWEIAQRSSYLQDAHREESYHSCCGASVWKSFLGDSMKAATMQQDKQMMLVS